MGDRSRTMWVESSYRERNSEIKPNQWSGCGRATSLANSGVARSFSEEVAVRATRTNKGGYEATGLAHKPL
jgi:hypothetical protein